MCIHIYIYIHVCIYIYIYVDSTEPSQTPWHNYGGTPTTAKSQATQTRQVEAAIHCT